MQIAYKCVPPLHENTVPRAAASFAHSSLGPALDKRQARKVGPLRGRGEDRGKQRKPGDGGAGGLGPMVANVEVCCIYLCG